MSCARTGDQRGRGSAGHPAVAADHARAQIRRHRQPGSNLRAGVLPIAGPYHASSGLEALSEARGTR